MIDLVVVEGVGLGNLALDFMCIRLLVSEGRIRLVGAIGMGEVVAGGRRAMTVMMEVKMVAAVRADVVRVDAAGEAAEEEVVADVADVVGVVVVVVVVVGVVVDNGRNKKAGYFTCIFGPSGRGEGYCQSKDKTLAFKPSFIY